MRIEIQNDDQVIVLDNEDLDNNNFVNISIIGQDEDVVSCEAVYLNELLAALESFRRIRELNKEIFDE